MVALYNSYLSPFIIIFSVPVAAIGAIGALFLTHNTLNLFSLIGTILLIGIATKNGILLVDYANTLRTRGRDKLSAIKESAHHALPADHHDELLGRRRRIFRSRSRSIPARRRARASASSSSAACSARSCLTLLLIPDRLHVGRAGDHYRFQRAAGIRRALGGPTRPRLTDRSLD